MAFLNLLPVRKLILLTGIFIILIITSVHFFENDRNRNRLFSTTTADKSQKEEKKTDKPEKFLEYHRGIRTRDGESAPAYLPGYKWRELSSIREYANARRGDRSGRTKSNGVVEWKERGPGNVPGRTRALFNIPGDPANNTWLAGAATGGIWRTTDGGQTWSERSRDFPVLPISSFAADAQATVIYAGTGEYVSSVYSAIGNGIFKSVDKGVTWTQLPSTRDNEDFSITTRLIVDPNDPDIIVASTVPSNLSTDLTSAIMRSTDGGETWSKVLEITGIFEQVIFTPGNFNVQYASQNGKGVWKSTDGGVTWQLSNQGMTPSGRVEIAVSPVNPNRLFASAVGNVNGTGSDLYVSHDAGATWTLVDIRFNNQTFDFFEGQGFYDNTILCDPFQADKIYFGGVSLFQATLGSGTTVVTNYAMTETGTTFLVLQQFSNIEYANQRLSVGTPLPEKTVEVRFGPNRSQKAHRFLVPENRTDGVAINEYTYQDYETESGFEVWDVTDANNPRQLMVSYRDQNRNGKFDLVPAYLTSGGTDYLSNSREYFYVHDIDYSPNPHTDISKNGGQEFKLLYSFFPALADDGVWDPSAIPESVLKISYAPVTKQNATTVTAADGRGSFDNKNKSDQVNLDNGVHPDHHCIIPIIENATLKTYKLLLGNDGGVFVSKVSTTPGITEGDWSFRGFGYNTSQFYGADKKPGADEYIGGMQDNGTRISLPGQSASAQTHYRYAIGGDGFETIWHSKDANKILGSVYYGSIYRSLNGGLSWSSAVTGLTPSSSEFPFVTKLANSKDFPDRVFTVGRSGVYVSTDFGGSWKLTPISSQFVTTSHFFLDVEVSRANANIVWAGSGMSSAGGGRRLFVSTDGGQTFKATNNYTVVPLGSITRLASHPTQENTAYALFSFSDAPKILRTTDLGETWEDISGFGTGTSSNNGFPDVAVYCLYVRPDNPDILWAGTEIGIVESLDNGMTWALIEDFPKVAVWDMKGQDDQVVIATHGRGIWTATIDKPQITVNMPAIIASGTSPQGKLVLRVESKEDFGKITFYDGSTELGSIENIAAGTLTDVTIDNISPGRKSISMIARIENAPYQSQVYNLEHLDILSPVNSYTTYFTDLTDVTVNGLSLQHFTEGSGSTRRSLHTNHHYSVNKTYEVVIRRPVVVSNTSPLLYHRDIAIVEPENDSVVVEATKNGIDWVALAPAYDASLHSSWLEAYQNNAHGTPSMFLTHETDISKTFAAGDQLLFRLRLVSGPTANAWGWAIDYIAIQETPLSTELRLSDGELSLYPNPNNGVFTLEYHLSETTEVSLRILDAFGKNIQSVNLGTKATGLHTLPVDISGSPNGNYLLILKTNRERKARRFSLVK